MGVGRVALALCCPPSPLWPALDQLLTSEVLSRASPPDLAAWGSPVSSRDCLGYKRILGPLMPHMSLLSVGVGEASQTPHPKCALCHFHCLVAAPPELQAT